MRILAKIVVVLIVLFLAAVAIRVLLVRHGHVDERLDVTVRIVDAGTGQPVAEAVAAVVRYRSMLGRDYFEPLLESQARADPAVRAQRQPVGMWEGPLGVTHTAAQSETVVATSVYVTRWWVAGIQVSKEVVVPRVLLVEHPDYGRTVLGIDSGALEEGDEPDTWRLDLGTIRLRR